jgi:hypothetical protein
MLRMWLTADRPSMNAMEEATIQSELDPSQDPIHQLVILFLERGPAEKMIRLNFFPNFLKY